MIVGRGKYLFSDAVLTVLVYIVIVRRLWVVSIHPNHLLRSSLFVHQSTIREISIADTRIDIWP